MCMMLKNFLTMEPTNSGLLIIKVILILCIYSKADRSQEHCKHWKGDQHIVFCKTRHLSQTLTSVSKNVTHLMVVLAKDPLHYNAELLDFSPFKQLEVLVLSAEGLRSETIRLSRHSFGVGQKLRVFESSVKVYMEENTFANLLLLEELFLSNTMHNWTFVKEMLNQSLSDKKNFHKLSLVHFDVLRRDYEHRLMLNICDIFLPLKDIPLTHLDLRQNDLRQVCPCFTIPEYSSLTCLSKLFHSLMTIDMRENDLTYPSALDKHPDADLFVDWLFLLQFMKNIKHIYLGQQGFPSGDISGPQDIKYLLTFQNKTETLSAPKTKIYHSSKQFNTRDCFYNMLIPLGQVETVSISHNKVFPGYLGFNIDKGLTICVSPNNVLRSINLANNAQWNMKRIGNLESYGLNQLEHLNLQYNAIDKFGRNFLSEVPSLRTLLLGGNAFGDGMSAENQSLYIDSNQDLEVLDLAQNSISQLPVNIFSQNTNLHVLNFSSNDMDNFNVNVSMLENLQLLNLSFNHISYLRPVTLQQLDSIANLSLDLKNNPLSCGCLQEQLQFITWVQNTNIHLIDKEELKCVYPFGDSTAYITEVHVEDLTAQCYPSKTKTIILSVFLSISLMLLICSFTTLYCKRWRLRYWMYLARLSWKRHQQHYDHTRYKYDVFVAYNWQDGYWVHGPLLRELEHNRGLKLCIHQRDFIPGEIIEEVIVDKIMQSRKTLLVLSPHFIQSNWCHFELHMARNRLFEEGKDVLILVILQSLPPATVNKTLYQLLRKKVYIEWSMDQDGQKLFWQKLGDVLTLEDRPFE